MKAHVNGKEPNRMSAFSTPGRFFKGNMHTHSNRSDGARDAESVCAVYRDAGYDFLALTDHFLARYQFPVVDTRSYRTRSFTTLLGAEVHAPETGLGELWHILSIGLPLDFAPTAEGELAAGLAQRCADAGAFVALAHPAWSDLQSPMPTALGVRTPSKSTITEAPSAPIGAMVGTCSISCSPAASA
jgi:hypothetical protein